jgi:hypothetical protein
MAKGHENLKPIGKRTTDEAREISKKGGIASGASRRRKKALRTALKEAVAMRLDELHPDMRNAIMQAAKLSDGELTVSDAILGSIIRNACKGDPHMMRILLDTIGESADVRLRGREVKLKEKDAALARGEDGKPKEKSTMVQLVESLQEARERRAP